MIRFNFMRHMRISVGLTAFLLFAAPGFVFGGITKDERGAVIRGKRYLNYIYQIQLEKAYGLWHPEKKSAEAKKNFINGHRRNEVIFVINRVLKKHVRNVNRVRIDRIETMGDGKIQLDYSVFLPGDKMSDVFTEELRKQPGLEENSPPAVFKKAAEKAARKVSAKLKKLPMRFYQSALLMAKHKGRFYFFDNTERK